MAMVQGLRCSGIQIILLSLVFLHVLKPINGFAVVPELLSSFKAGGPCATDHLEASVSSSQNHLENTSKHISGWAAVALHLSGCLISAAAVCYYEDYDCRNLKPNRYLRPQGAVRGMGEGHSDRVQNWRQGDVLIADSDDTSLANIPSYNEIMQWHRRERVPSWDKSVNDQDVRVAVSRIFRALAAVNQLKLMADDYRWDAIQAEIRSPVLSDDLEMSCSILRRASFALSEDARREIGFDWGSCAWRHCGAEADAQEALAELYNLSGVLEPFECRFVLDIVERSLRDVLSVIPVKYYDQALDKYQSYQFRDADDENSNQDEELLKAISKFRNPQWDDV
jgi:hypothetical protein